jgi:hypothetical protein
MIALEALANEIYIGNGNGEIKVLDETFKLKRAIKICSDVISDIKAFGDILTVTSYDGTVATVNLQTN